MNDGSLAKLQTLTCNVLKMMAYFLNYDPM